MRKSYSVRYQLSTNFDAKNVTFSVHVWLFKHGNFQQLDSTFRGKKSMFIPNLFAFRTIRNKKVESSYVVRLM